LAIPARFCITLVFLELTTGTWPELKAQQLPLLAKPGETEWVWKDAEGTILSLADLKRIVSRHQLWIAKAQKANVSNWREASISYGRDPDRARLFAADLRRANLNDLDLRGVDLTAANLSGASFLNTNLRGAGLESARLVGTVFLGADLTEADLANADLSGALLYHADLRGARYEPSQNPAPQEIAFAKNLGRVWFSVNVASLAKLKQALRDSGFHAAERQVIAALHRHDAAWWETVLFDWTTEFGSNSARPLGILLALWLLCSLLYVSFMHWSKVSGLYVVGKRIRGSSEVTQGMRIRPKAIAKGGCWKYTQRFVKEECRLVRTAAFFSLMSTFNIAFSNVHFGRWLRLLMRREYDLKATNWARTVAGWQALISVGLIALTLLTYFGRPFDH